jgi:hypothetical protein
VHIGLLPICCNAQSRQDRANKRRDDRAGEPTGGKMRKAEHRPAGGADDQGFGKAGERIAQ